MRRLLFALLITMCSVAGYPQFLLFLDKGDIFKSPEVDMVVMDKYSFARMHFVAEKYDSLKRELFQYDSALIERDSMIEQLRITQEEIIRSKDAQLNVITEGYNSLKASLQSSIEEQKKLEIEYRTLQHKQRKTRRWRNFFMGTSALFGAIVYLVVR